MYTLGMILMAVGAILFFGSRMIFKKYEKSIKINGQGSSDEDFLMLISNAMFAVKAIGAVLVLGGGTMLIFVK